MDFVAFPKIHRLNRESVITEKLDGTNAAVVVTDAGVYAQSRNRVITPDDDNFGFAAWVCQNAERLAALLGPGRHFGEWWGVGIQRGYGLRERRFSLFNALKWGPDAVLDADLGVYVVPTLAVADSLSTVQINIALHRLREDGSFAAPGFTRPEGIVVHHVASRQSFKVLLENDDVPKSAVA